MPLALQPGLLFVEELVGDAVFVVHVQQLAFLLADFVEYALAAIDLGLGGGDSLPEVVPDGLAHLLVFGLAQPDGLVVALDGRLDEVDGPVALGALPALVAGADEVLVGAAVAFVAGVEQARAADAADAALQVVQVLAVALAAQVVRVQYGLHLVEEFLADELWMPSGILLAAVADYPRVVPVGEQFVDAGEAKRL